jgi:hypothetical protein
MMATTFAGTEFRAREPAMADAEYRPGICNIGPEGEPDPPREPGDRCWRGHRLGTPPAVITALDTPGIPTGS